MKAISKSVLSLFILVLLTFFIPSVHAQLPPIYQVIGRVADIGLSPTPAPNTCTYDDSQNTFQGQNYQVVELHGTNNSLFRITSTNKVNAQPDGTFIFQSIPAGTYNLCYVDNARQDVSISCSNGGTLTRNGNQSCVPITVPGQQTGNRFFVHDITPVPGNKVSGRVYDVAAAPVVVSCVPGTVQRDGEIMSLHSTGGINVPDLITASNLDYVIPPGHGAFNFQNVSNGDYNLCHVQDTERNYQISCNNNQGNSECTNITVNNAPVSGLYFNVTQVTGTPSPSSSPTPGSSGTPTPATTISPTVCDRTHGDANCDGVVNSVDYLYYVRYNACISGPIQVDCSAILPANVNLDLNGDSKINDLDRVVIVTAIRGPVVPSNTITQPAQ